LRSKLLLLRFPLLLAAVALIALAGRSLFCTRLDPEIEFYTQFCKNKLAWSGKMTREHGKKVVVIGGSSVAFSVIGTRMLEQHGLPAVNLGLEAPFGATMLTHWALGELHPGDKLIVSLEPPVLTRPHELVSSGCKISNALGHPEWVYQPWEVPTAPWLGTALHSNIGWQRLVVVWKSYFRKKKNKTRWPYTLAETDASGWQTTDRRMEVPELSPYYGTHLSTDNKKLLSWTRQWCEAHGVRVAYSLAWAYREANNAAELQQANAALLAEISQILPVLKDPRLGTYPGRQNYLDTFYHLSREAAERRSDELARQIQAWDVWKPGELEALSNGRRAPAQ